MAGWVEDRTLGWVYLDDNGMPATPPADDPGAGPTMDAPAGAPAPTPAPPVPPQPAPPVPPAGMQSAGTGGSAGYDVSYTPQDRVDQLASAAASDYGAAEAWGQAEYGNLAKPLVDQYGQAGRRVMSDQEYANAPSEAAATSAQLDAKARLQKHVGDLYGQFYREEAAAQVASQAHVAQVEAEYRTAVQQFASMKVNPSQWWEGLSGGEQVGTLASVFVANFLGMQGKPTTVMATINQAIDRNIRAQEYNIQTGGQVAGMYKQLYDMAVAQSATQSEARERLRGFHLAQVQNEIAAELGRYDAPLAMAKLAEARAALEGELNQNLLKIREYVGNRVKAIQDNWTSLRQTQINAAAQRYASRLAYDAEMARVKASTQPNLGAMSSELNERVITDPTKPGAPVVGATRTKEEGAKIREAQAKYADVASRAITVRNLFDKVGAIYGGGTFNYAINPEDARAVQAAREDLMLILANARSGKTMTEFELKKFEKMIPEDTWLTRDGVQTIYNDLVLRTAKELDSQWRSQVGELTDTERALVQGGYVAPGLTSAKPLESLVAAANEEGPAETEADKVLMRIRDTASNEPASGSYPGRTEEAWIAVSRNSPVSLPDQPTHPPAWFADAYKGVIKVMDDPEEAAKLDGLLDAYAKEAAGTPGAAVRVQAVKYLRDRLGVQVKNLNEDYDADTQGPLVPMGIDPATVVE